VADAEARHGPPAEEPRVEDHYIATERSLAERPMRVLKSGDLFGLFAADGGIGVRRGPEGLYWRDTRYLSRLTLRIGGRPPLLLGSSVAETGALIVDLTNADIEDEAGEIVLLRSSLFAGRTRFLSQASCFERIALRNHQGTSLDVLVELEFASDFADLFEVRGDHRARRGSVTAGSDGKAEALLAYAGLDGIERRARLRFDPPPDRLQGDAARWRLRLEPGARASLSIAIGCEAGDAVPAPLPSFGSAWRTSRRTARARSLRLERVSGGGGFDDLIRRSALDLDMLVSQTPSGPYPYAGIPWYSTIFGRDGIITAMLLLAEAPDLAKGVLATLAALQADRTDPAADAEPGKILHEARSGEMALLGEVPFRRYYGSVDATPLFVMLAGAWHRRSGDRETIERLWPAIEAAMGWIEGPGDADGDGFVEYGRPGGPSAQGEGLANQGWKDSHDSIFHADGRPAEGPIALVEVQAYAFAARRAAARMARALGREVQAKGWDADATALRRRFERAFWIEEIGSYALALDGEKAPCRVRASNAGHALWAGIASAGPAARVARLLMSREFFSGWGVRTLASGEPRYNPMSYHNGSVWPHDNALIALGLARYGLRASAARIFEGLHAAAGHDEQSRLPELFCGFPRRPRRGPVAYPVACSPQAWAAAAPFGLLAACTGLDMDFARMRITLDAPVLPSFLDTLIMPDLALGDARVGLRLARHGADVTVAVTERKGDAKVVVEK